jgi:carboxymethylenebutenolidase
MALEEYLAGEVVEDYADGLVSRREALRRLGLLGLGAGASVQLLAGCSGEDDDGSAASSTTSASTSTAPTTDPSAIPGDETSTTAADDSAAETIRFDGSSGELIAAWAAAAESKAGLLVVHENRGLTPHFPALVERFAADGYSSLCVDLLSPEGGTAALTDPAGAPAALGAAPLERLLGDLRAGIDELQRRVPDRKVGAIGFCFGGGMVWNLLQAGEARLAAAAPFYGPAPADADFSGAEAAVFAVYAELDERVNASREAATAALEAAGLTHEVKTYAGAGHAFFNDTGERYHEAAATEAYADVLAWFGQHLA